MRKVSFHLQVAVSGDSLQVRDGGVYPLPWSVLAGTLPVPYQVDLSPALWILIAREASELLSPGQG